MTSSSEQTTALIAEARGWDADGVNRHSVSAADTLRRLADALEAARAKRNVLLELVQPILDRTAGQIGTHSDTCYQYHVACLADLVKVRLGGTE